ncbi:MAG: hypothetical protein KC964_11935 [Candidatus Omnitrophica bacterium]|nr:hypothetical protein [Candidatus Omnitrophota bacterium]
MTFRKALILPLFALTWAALQPSDSLAQIYNPYYSTPYGGGYASGYGYGYGGYGGVNYYNYNAPYSHIYYSPTYQVQPRGYYTVPYYYGGYYLDGGGHHGGGGHKPSHGGGGYKGYSSSSSRGEVPAGTVGWIPAPVSPRSQKVQSGK